MYSPPWLSLMSEYSARKFLYFCTLLDHGITLIQISMELCNTFLSIEKPVQRESFARAKIDTLAMILCKTFSNPWPVQGCYKEISSIILQVHSGNLVASFFVFVCFCLFLPRTIKLLLRICLTLALEKQYLTLLNKNNITLKNKHCPLSVAGKPTQHNYFATFSRCCKNNCVLED